MLESPSSAPPRPISLICGGYAAIIGSLMFMILPVIVGALARGGGLSDAQLPVIGSAPMFGMFLGATLASAFLDQLMRPRVAAALTVFMAAAYAAIASRGIAPGLVAAAFLLAGVMGTGLMGLGLAQISRSPNPDRAFAIWVCAQSAFGALLVPPLGAVLDHAGLAGGGWLLAGVTVTAAPAAALSVTRASRGPAAAAGGPGQGMRVQLAVLLSVLAFGAGTMAIWTPLERIGEANLGSVSLSRTVVSASLFVGILAALASSLAAGRIGRAPQLIGASVAILLGAVLVTRAHAPTPFLVGGLLFYFGWNFAPASQLGVMASLDPSGRLTVMSIGALKLGYALGPLVGGLVSDPTFRWRLAIAAILVAAWAAVFVTLHLRYVRLATGRKNAPSLSAGVASVRG